MTNTQLRDTVLDKWGIRAQRLWPSIHLDLTTQDPNTYTTKQIEFFHWFLTSSVYEQRLITVYEYEFYPLPHANRNYRISQGRWRRWSQEQGKYVDD